ncbi:MAG: hypothetical protein E7C11_10200 [Klebsiella michiganensis]|nr:hypothetical protein [Klebsiella michiganensis]
MRKWVVPNFKKWKPGEIKAYLAEQRALTKGEQAKKEMVKNGAIHDAWVEACAS